MSSGRGAATAAATAAAILALAAGGCAPVHPMTEERFSAPLDSQPRDAGPSVHGPDRRIEALVRFNAGSVRVGRVTAGLAWDARILYCTQHTRPIVEYAAPGEGRGRLEIALASSGAGFIGFGGEGNDAWIGLPAEGLSSLHVEAGAGESVVDLSEVAVPRVRVNAGAGDTHVVFPEAGAIADLVVVNGSVGDVTIDRLAGVSPREAQLSGGVGGLDIDLAGRWRGESHVAVLGSVGAVHLVLPRATAISALIGSPWRASALRAGFRLEGDRFLGPEAPAGSPRLTLTLEPGLGALDLEWEESP